MSDPVNVNLMNSARTLGHQMPPRRVQRVIRAPLDARAVRFARAVLELIGRPKLRLRIEGAERIDVSEPAARQEVSTTSWRAPLMSRGHSRVGVQDFERLAELAGGVSVTDHQCHHAGV